MIRDFERLIVPALTHWNHPGFIGYFATSSSPPAVLAEFLAAAINQQAMLWRTSPAATELEAVTLGWLRDLMGLPPAFEGVIYDTASMSTLHALAAAREAAVDGVRDKGLPGRADVGALRVYCSDQAHSSVDKSVILLGLGHEGLCRVPSDSRIPDVGAGAARRHRPRPGRGRDAGRGGRDAGHHFDDQRRSGRARSPTSANGRACGSTPTRAYAGVAAIIPEHPAAIRRLGARGLDRRQPAQVAVRAGGSQRVLHPAHGRAARQAFSLVPEFLRTTEGTAGVRNLMDTGVQLGRRFRALKLWMVLRAYGAEGAAGDAGRAHAPGPAVRRLGGRGALVRAAGAGPVQRRVLPRGAARVCPPEAWTPSTSGCSRR